MKGRRGKARRVVVPRHGRCVRLSGGEKRRRSHQLRAGEGVGWTAKHAKRVLEYGDGSAAPIVRTAKEKQEIRSRRAIKKQTVLGKLGLAARAARERFAALQNAKRKEAQP